MWSSDNPFYCICIVYITKYFCKQIVLQDTEDDESSAGIAQDPPESGDPHREDFREDHVAGDEIPRLEPEYFDGFPQVYNGRKKEIAGRRMSFINSSAANMPNGDEKLFFPQEEPIEYSGSRGQNRRNYGGNFSSSHDERYLIVHIPQENTLKMSTFICMLMFFPLLYFVVIIFISFYRHP